MIPDGEKLVSAYLRTHPSIAAMNAKVVGKPPDDIDSTPWIRFTQIDASNAEGMTPDYLITFYFQLDCYSSKAGGQPEAQTLGRTARAALDAVQGVALSGTAGTAVVSEVKFPSMARIPDSDGMEPARERIVLDTTVIMHAA